MAEAKRGVRATHPEYDRMAPKWKRARDVVSGRDAIEAAGVAYLPRLTDQTSDSYKGYLRRASFYNASWRTVMGLTGMLFRKPMIVECPEGVRPLLEDVTLTGQPMHLFANDVAMELLTVDRVAVLVDFPAQEPLPTAGGEVTKGQAEEAGLRPSLSLYRTEALINWRHARIRNRHVLSMAVMTEQHREPVDEFSEAVTTRYRVLDLNPANGFYRQRVFRINDRDMDEQVGGDVYPLLNGQPMTFIPLHVFGANGVNTCPEDPSLIDLFDLNLDHYRVSADYERGCHLTAIPTPWIAGWSPEIDADGKPKQVLYIGSESAWVFPNPQAKADMLEFSGAGLNELRENMASKESRMAILGARMLEEQKRDAEAADTAAIHRTGEGSILASIATSISLSLTAALVTFCDWAGSPDEKAKVNINRDFMPAGMDPATMQALLSAWQAGAISYTTLFNRLKNGEVIDEDRTEEDEKGAIEEEPPSPALVPDTAKAGKPDPEDEPPAAQGAA